MCRCSRAARAWLAALLAVAACTVAASPVDAVDDTGRRVRLDAPAARIVSLSPHLTELLFAAGAGGRAVGAVDWSDFPVAARALPRVGDATRLDLERIVALRPDLVLAWQGGNPAGQVERLEALGLRVWRSDPRTVADIAGALRAIGRLAGTGAAAEARAVAFESRIAALRAASAARPPLSVAYLIWHRPWMTVNGSHLISEALSACGARNVFAGLAPLTPTIDVEAVMRADPDAIVSGIVDGGAGDGLDPWRRWPALRAVRQGALVHVDPDRLHRATDRFADGVADLCAQLDAVRSRAPAAR
jgi:iron complex transport system substrate-binding protein